MLLAVHAALAFVGCDLTSVASGPAVTALAMTYWISAVRPHRVRQHGETYACRLLETLDWPTAAPTPAAPAPPLA